MRNLALREEPDFDTPPSRNRGRATAKAQARSASPMRGLLVMNWRRFLILTSAALLGAVVINALFFQTARHPAPLFSGGHVGASTPAPQPASTAARVVPATETPTPAPRPVEVAAAPQRPVAAPRGISDLIDPPKPVASEPKGNDPIAALLKGAVGPGQAPGASTTTVAQSDPAAKRVTAAQKALAKLGYSVTVDGIFGSGTKQAIQKFEQDRKLPLTGEIAGRTQRELATRSGIQIN
ncbi:MAG TPA: peptidoglycan-binding protein [Beijerinckiaceae bacterium]|nr:peptidoglycan-binding protein [Beijerinckiaceae bacterium]